MSDKSYIDLSSILEKEGLPPELRKELKIVELNLNLTPSEKDKNGNWGPSKVNTGVMKHLQVTVRKIAGMVDQGLSYAADDYYIYSTFGGQVAVKKGPNGMIRAMTNAATAAGYQCTINVGCVFEDYEAFTVTRDGRLDKLHLINSPERELEQAGDDIRAPYAVVTLLNAGVIQSSKVTIVRRQEYQNARSQGSGTHKLYPVPMAQKIALYRAGKELLSSLGIADDDDEGADLKRELKDHEAEHPVAPAETAEKKLSEEELAAMLPEWKTFLSTVKGDKGKAIDKIIKGLESRFDVDAAMAERVRQELKK